MLRGLIAGVFGLMIAFIGYNDVTGVLRFTAGISYLWDGVHLVPALIGLFAVAEMINLSVKGRGDYKRSQIRRDHQRDERTSRNLPSLANGVARVADRHRRRSHPWCRRHRWRILSFPTA